MEYRSGLYDQILDQRALSTIKNAYLVVEEDTEIFKEILCCTYSNKLLVDSDK